MGDFVNDKWKVYPKVYSITPFVRKEDLKQYS